ncbi:hypothetical protein AB0I60_31075 [Actinosynnema sp. NPDC050436]|uniref:hypothetical protein n=1 Tax=Actinosynnema sp. NPDC050436 TaxID=3155659 RepID=UPI0034047B86
MALLAGDLDNAATKFARADEIYAEAAGDAEVDRERAECHVLMGRLAHLRGDPETARRWFGAALEHLPADAAGEVWRLTRAIDAGRGLSASGLLPVGEFGSPDWARCRTPVVE